MKREAARSRSLARQHFAVKLVTVFEASSVYNVNRAPRCAGGTVSALFLPAPRDLFSASSDLLKDGIISVTSALEAPLLSSSMGDDFMHGADIDRAQSLRRVANRSSQRAQIRSDEASSLRSSFYPTHYNLVSVSTPVLFTCTDFPTRSRSCSKFDLTAVEKSGSTVNRPSSGV
ncbi:hypothetical protein RRG08_067060 [Elysia crispata]|uniref:Uncharacterized protein n=1 Tax=Elysia crispata TaxID=231223 RepID=A0AAE1EBV0_9GAST|nr:hypothetical protein RRG08_067060 [Elysia crispata]